MIAEILAALPLLIPVGLVVWIGVRFLRHRRRMRDIEMLADWCNHAKGN